MTPEQEAQQAQIQRHDMESIPHGMEFYYEMRPADDGEWVKWDDHKEIVDSQAQKIAEQEKEIERLKNALSTAEWYGEPDPLNMVAGGPGAPGYDGPV